MTSTDRVVPSEQRGRTVIGERALQRMTTGIAKDAARLTLREVTVSLSDDAGSLRVGVALPVVIEPLTIAEQGDRLRTGIIRGVEELAGRRVSAVDIRFTGVRESERRRVL